MKQSGLFFMLLLGVVRVYAQDKGIIEGRVKDVQGHPLSAVTVRLVDGNDPATTKTVLTDTAGRFFIDGIPYGLFTCTVTQAGTQSITVDSIPVTPISGTINLGDLVLLPAGKLLTEAVVSARPTTIRIGPEKKVFSVNQSLVSAGGSAADVLQNVPTLQVDASGEYDPDYDLINRLTSTSGVHAAYVSYRRDWKGFSFQLGARGEIGRFSATLASFDPSGKPVAVPIRVNTHGIYPSLLLKKQLGEGRQLQLSYSRRINRPTPRELNPFLDVSDPVNYDGGNPRLLPEDLHSVELTFSRTRVKSSLTAELYYNQVNRVIKHIQSDPVNDVTITISQNLGRAINTGVELIGSFHPSKVLDLTTNVNLYERINDGDPAFGISATHGLSWNANVTGNLSLCKNLSIQLRADYKAPEVIVQDRYGSAWGLDGGARYEFLHHKASLAVNGRDIFNTRKPNFLRVSDALLLDWQRVTYSARASLTFTYRMGRSGPGGGQTKRPEEQQAKRIENR